MFPLFAAKYGYGKDTECAEQANTANIIFMRLVQACFNMSERGLNYEGYTHTHACKHLQDTLENSMMVLEGSTPEEAPG